MAAAVRLQRQPVWTNDPGSGGPNVAIVLAPRRRRGATPGDRSEHRQTDIKAQRGQAGRTDRGPGRRAPRDSGSFPACGAGPADTGVRSGRLREVNGQRGRGGGAESHSRLVQARRPRPRPGHLPRRHHPRPAPPGSCARRSDPRAPAYDDPGPLPGRGDRGGAGGGMRGARRRSHTPGPRRPSRSGRVIRSEARARLPARQSARPGPPRRAVALRAGDLHVAHEGRRHRRGHRRRRPQIRRHTGGSRSLPASPPADSPGSTREAGAADRRLAGQHRARRAGHRVAGPRVARGGPQRPSPAGGRLLLPRGTGLRARARGQPGASF